jgi:uncharacterized protein (TIGR03086 family)
LDVRGADTVVARGAVAMTTDTEVSLDVLTRAIDQAEAVLSEVTPDQLSDPTPCSDWDLAALVSHLVADPRNFVAMARGEEVDWSAAPPLPDNWTAEFRSGGDELIGQWRDAGDSASAQGIDWQTAEFAVHTWDVVRALGLSIDLDDEVAQRGLDFMRAALTSENRGEVFGPPVPVDDELPVYERLAAWAGRSPR